MSLLIDKYYVLKIFNIDGNLIGYFNSVVDLYLETPHRAPVYKIEDIKKISGYQKDTIDLVVGVFKSKGIDVYTKYVKYNNEIRLHKLNKIKKWKV